MTSLFLPFFTFGFFGFGGLLHKKQAKKDVFAKRLAQFQKKLVDFRLVFA